ncbi:DNA polymerase alpha subunit B-like isoform X2 [Durio zibethinus]|uniref:DNA polymerase alpha subunit B n=1 Tax=Durio zibethinus TaxID=66656 RepID=A0A6P6BGM0_DURZI|nr:DNA polymerase alpha subunit B-like isoform X2 [Durio zibethinus]
MEEKIKAEFLKSGFTLEDEEEILKKCRAFCLNYSLEPSDLVSSWEVYYLNRQLDESVVKDADMYGFLGHLQDEQVEAVVKREPGLHMYSFKDVDMILNDEGEDSNEVVLGTPSDKSEILHLDEYNSAQKTNGNICSSGRISKLVTPFGKRSNKFVVKLKIDNLPTTETMNGMHHHENLEDDIIKRIQPNKSYSLVVHRSWLEPGCRFIYDRIEDRFNALENRIRNHAAALVASGLYEEPVDPSVASQSIFAVGMICCDGEGHLNDKSILLQSSVEHSGGQRVRLELNKLSHFSVFPGQVVGIKGHNPSGHCLIASELVDSVPLSFAADTNLRPAKKQALDEEIQATKFPSSPTEITLIIAAGPFTTTENLLFEPLKELLTYATRKCTQLLILLGPFIDSEHPQIKKGTVDLSFDEVFRLEVLRMVQDYLGYMGSNAQVVIIPSVRDANHDFVFPQPAFDLDPLDIKHQITSLTNPGIFEADEVKIGCCTVDILKHLSGEELSRHSVDGTPSDRLSRLASHILSQRSFYPLYPPAEGVPLDFSLAPEALNISSVPDLLILPSDIKYFVKVVSLGGTSEGEEQMKKCVCINPGRLAKGEGGGTFVELKYQGSPDKMNASIIGI